MKMIEKSAVETTKNQTANKPINIFKDFVNLFNEGMMYFKRSKSLMSGDDVCENVCTWK